MMSVGGRETGPVDSNEIRDAREDMAACDYTWLDVRESKGTQNIHVQHHFQNSCGIQFNPD